MQQQLYFVGTNPEIEHHAAPLSGRVEFRIVPPERIIDIVQPGDLAVFYSEHFDRFRYAIDELRRRNAATLYMIDGVLEWKNAWENSSDEPACPFTMRPVLADKVACIGASQARVLAAWGNRRKTEVVGVPRFDRLKTLPKRSRGDNRFRLLVMTAKCPGYTPIDRLRLLGSLQELRKYLQENQPEIEVVWRLTAGLDQELGVDNHLSDLTGNEIAGLLTTVDAVITAPSTAALESMLLDIPTAIIDYSNSPSYVQSAWRISASSHLASQISDLIDPPASKMLFQRQFLVDELYLAGNATERLVELLDRMLQIIRECLAGKSKIEFPGQVLDRPLPIDPEFVEFEHASIYPDFSEFQIDDKPRLQTELAHARREIVHLHRQLAQVQSELNEAHQVFDEINGHPIAGPVVRIRQRLIDAIQKLKQTGAQPEPH